MSSCTTACQVFQTPLKNFEEFEDGLLERFDFATVLELNV